MSRESRLMRGDDPRGRARRGTMLALALAGSLGGAGCNAVLGIDEAPSADQGVLINLGSSLSPHVERFSRIIEIVNQQPELLSACRENFRTYRQRGYDPQRVEL